MSPLPVIFSFAELLEEIRSIRDNTPPFTDFSAAQLRTLSQFFVWRMPERFFINDDELIIRRGFVRINKGKNTLELSLSNGYRWLVDFDI